MLYLLIVFSIQSTTLLPATMGKFKTEAECQAAGQAVEDSMKTRFGESVLRAKCIPAKGLV